MDYEKIREEVPAEEQQLYIDAKLELRRIEEMAKLPDSEYIEMLDNIKKNGDDIQLEQFLQTYISIGEYERIKSENEAWINEIDQKYGVEEERRVEEIRVEALRKRPQLERLQRYYERNGSNIMRNVDVASLSDEDVLRLYDEVTFGIDNETLKNMLNDDIRNRVGKTGSASGDKVEEEIEKFKNESEEIKNQLNEIKASLVLGGDEDLDITDAVRGLTSELAEISNAADDLIEMIDASKAVDENIVFSMTPAEIKNLIKGFKDRLKEIKQHQIDKYNARVDSTNRLLEELRGMDGIDAEIPENISRCDADVTDWRNIKYLEQIDYNKLIEVNKLIAEIKGQQKEDEEIIVDLESDMVAIEKEIINIDEAIENSKTSEELEGLKQDILRVSNRVMDFRTKLENNKDKISEEEYNNYLNRVNAAEAKLKEMSNRIAEKEIGTVVNDNDYKELLAKLEKLHTEVNYCNNMVESLYGHLDEEGVSKFVTMIDENYQSRLEDIRKEIKEKYKDGKLDDNQYNQLIKKFVEIKSLLEKANGKLKEPNMIKDVDIFAYLNGRIDGIENAIDTIEKKVESLEKPIKDKNVRRELDRIINRLEEEIKYLEGILEKHKEDDPEKYKETKEKLDKAKEKLDKVSKNYRKKCPLLVRAVKSAKEFYKKHKKACLIIAGLAAFALVGYHVLIPAIMHGNIMIGATTPALRGFVSFVNNVLGNVIGASKNIHGVWSLANGVMINPAVASTSLLKGLAVSGVNSAMLVAPIVVAVKKLVEKMKTAELKQKITEIKEKEKTKKEKKSAGKKKTKTADKMSIDELADLMKEYRKSGMTLDEFCAEYGLSEEEKAIIRYLEEKSKENAENLENTGRKGRK